MDSFVRDFLLQRDGSPRFARWRSIGPSPVCEVFNEFEAIKYGLSLKIMVTNESQDILEYPCYLLVWRMHEQPDGRMKEFLQKEGVPMVLSLREFPITVKRHVMFRISDRIADCLMWALSQLFTRYIEGCWKHFGDKFWKYLLNNVRHNLCLQTGYGVPCPVCFSMLEDR